MNPNLFLDNKKLRQNFPFSRWFRTGCCECVGNTCINYGLKDNRCADCPDHLSENDGFDGFDDDDRKDYGDEMGPMDGTINNGVE